MSEIESAMLLLETEYGKLIKKLEKAEKEVNMSTTERVLKKKCNEIGKAIEILRDHEEGE